MCPIWLFIRKNLATLNEMILIPLSSLICVLYTVERKCSCSTVSDSLWPLWTVVHQALLSMGFSWQESWRMHGCHALLQGDLLIPGIKLGSPTLQADSSVSEPVASVVSNSLLPMNGSLTSSSVHEILQARILEWVSSWLRDWTCVS